MLKCSITLKGSSPISFSKPVSSIRDPKKQTHDQFEESTWRERLHVNADGHVFIPPGALKNCLVDIAQYRQEAVPGKRNATYTKRYECGVMVMDELVFDPPIRPEDVKGERLFVPSDGKRGGGSRVWKRFPLIPAGWHASGIIYSMEPAITPDQLKDYLEDAGLMIGMGRFRPRRNGFYGRFTVERFDAEEIRKQQQGEA